MISIAALQRSVAVFGVLAFLVLGEWLLFVHGVPGLSGVPASIVMAVCAFAFLSFASWLTAWERKRRREDELAVQAVVEAARTLGFEVPEDRAILPVFYRGRRASRTAD